MALQELPKPTSQDLLTQIQAAANGLGGGKTTQSTMSGTSSSLGSLDEIVAMLTSTLGSGAYSKDSAFADSEGAITQIFEEFKNTVLPQIFQAQSNSGGYNSTTGQLMANDAFSKAVNQGAALKLKTASDYAANQVNLANAATNAAGTTAKMNTTTTQTAKASPLSSILSLGSLAAKAAPFILPNKTNEVLNKGKKAIPKGKFEKDAGEATAESGAQSFPGDFPEAPEATELGVPGQDATGISSNVSGFDSGGAFSSDVVDLQGIFSPDAIDTGLSALSGADESFLSSSALGIDEALGVEPFVADATDLGFGAGAVEAGAFNAAGDLITGGLGYELGGEALAGLGLAEVGGAELLGSSIGGSLAAEAAGASILEEAAVAAVFWVICTELKYQGKLDTKDCAKATPYFLRLPKNVVAGYHFWAFPYVKLMKLPIVGKFFTSLVRPIAQARVDYLNGKANLIGKLTVVFGEPLCGFIGS